MTTALPPLHVSDEGPRQAPVLVCLHALGTHSGLWEPQAQHYSGRWRVLRIDAPGHGLSQPWPSQAVSQASMAHAVWTALDRLETPYVNLMGTSMGAVTALQAAALAPGRVRSLVLCGALLRRMETSQEDMLRRVDAVERNGLDAVAPAMMERWFPPGTMQASGAWRDAVERMLHATSPHAYAACARAMTDYDVTPALQIFQDRCLLLTGEADAGIPGHFDVLAAQYPKLVSRRMARTGHYPNLQAPDLFNEIVERFLTSPGAG